MITKASTVGIHVSDQDRALDFYTSKLGFEKLADEPMGEGARWIEVAPQGAETRLVLFTPPGQEDRIGTFSNVVLSCDDIEVTHKQLKDRGGVHRGAFRATLGQVGAVQGSGRQRVRPYRGGLTRQAMGSEISTLIV